MKFLKKLFSKLRKKPEKKEEENWYNDKAHESNLGEPVENLGGDHSGYYVTARHGGDGQR